MGGGLRKAKTVKAETSQFAPPTARSQGSNKLVKAARRKKLQGPPKPQTDLNEVQQGLQPSESPSAACPVGTTPHQLRPIKAKLAGAQRPANASLDSADLAMLQEDSNFLKVHQPGMKIKKPSLPSATVHHSLDLDMLL